MRDPLLDPLLPRFEGDGAEIAEKIYEEAICALHEIIVAWLVFLDMDYTKVNKSVSTRTHQAYGHTAPPMPDRLFDAKTAVQALSHRHRGRFGACQWRHKPSIVLSTNYCGLGMIEPSPHGYVFECQVNVTVECGTYLAFHASSVLNAFRYMSSSLTGNWSAIVSRLTYSRGRTRYNYYYH